jgi:hypothetical protein
LPAELPIPSALKSGKWKVKICEDETREPPHVTIFRRTKTWRINLRTGEFMDTKPKPSEVPKNLLKHVKKPKSWKWLQEQWNAKYPGNPVEVTKNADNDKKKDDEGNAKG